VEGYTYSEQTTSPLPFFGNFATYGPGGYAVDLGLGQSAAISAVNELKSDHWLDDSTRALIVDVGTFNPNTKLFSFIKIVFEKPTPGGVFVKKLIQTSRLYPYIEVWDYFVLFGQLTFVVVTIVRCVTFGIALAKRRLAMCLELGTWVRLISLILSMAAVLGFALRVHYTITLVEEIFNNRGKLALILGLSSAYLSFLP
jgi:hypothetical protein